MKTAAEILHDRLLPLNTKSNNKASLDTQLTLVIQAAELAMEEYASERTKELEKENEDLTLQVQVANTSIDILDSVNSQLREAMISAIEDLKDWQDAGPSRRIKDAIWSLESTLSSVEDKT